VYYRLRLLLQFSPGQRECQTKVLFGSCPGGGLLMVQAPRSVRRETVQGMALCLALLTQLSLVHVILSSESLVGFRFVSEGQGGLSLRRATHRSLVAPLSTMNEGMRGVSSSAGFKISARLIRRLIFVPVFLCLSYALLHFRAGALTGALAQYSPEVETCPPRREQSVRFSHTTEPTKGLTQPHRPPPPPPPRRL
jgi:hypothetical protein